MKRRRPTTKYNKAVGKNINRKGWSHKPRGRWEYSPFHGKKCWFASSSEADFFGSLQKSLPGDCLLCPHPLFHYRGDAWEIDFLILFSKNRVRRVRELWNHFGVDILGLIPERFVVGKQMRLSEYYLLPIEYKGGCKGNGTFYLDDNFFKRCIQFKGSGVLDSLLVVGDNNRKFSCDLEVRSASNFIYNAGYEDSYTALTIYPQHYLRYFFNSVQPTFQ